MSSCLWATPVVGNEARIDAWSYSALLLGSLALVTVLIIVLDVWPVLWAAVPRFTCWPAWPRAMFANMLGRFGGHLHNALVDGGWNICLSFTLSIQLSGRLHRTVLTAARRIKGKPNRLCRFQLAMRQR